MSYLVKLWIKYLVSRIRKRGFLRGVLEVVKDLLYGVR